MTPYKQFYLLTMETRDETRAYPHSVDISNGLTKKNEGTGKEEETFTCRSTSETKFTLG